MRISPFALFAVSNILKVTESAELDTFKGCEVPSFEWATFATTTASRTKGLRGAISGDNIFAAGNVRSNSDAETDPGIVQIGLTGPFSVDDPTGIVAKTIEVDVMSYPESAGYKENAGGSFGQYEIGVSKIDRNTGEPKDLFVYGGYGMDETSGLAAKGDAIAVSGHFTGGFTAVLVDGIKTIWNSNIEEGGVPDQADQFHPNIKDNAGHTGVDDGFVIKARASDGKADWIVRYPESNKDSQVVAVDIDVNGNVFGSGYKCSQADGAEEKVCDGIVAKMNSTDGSIMWEKTLPELGAAFYLKYDSEDESLYVSGTTSYGGAAKGKKEHSLCDHDTCAITLRISAEDGSVEWERSAKGSPRWGIVDATGGVELATAGDGPFIYVAFDDVGDDKEGITSLDAGTHYAGCKLGDIITPEYNIETTRVMIETDCPQGTTFVPRSSDQAVPASQADTGAHCGYYSKSDACLIKYHKYTGLPIWGADVPAVAGLVPSSDGESVHISGRYSAGRADSFDDNIFLPGYARIGGLGSQVSGLFNAKLSAQTGKGEYVLHSGGGNWDRISDSVGDSDGNIYNIGFSGNLVMNWGGRLKTTIQEDGVDKGDVDPGTPAIEDHMFISKLAAHTETAYSCLTQCDGNTDTAIISDNSCFIDGQCYMEGDTGAFYGKSCWTCDPSKDQKNWVQGSTIGTTQCYIDKLCLNNADAYFYQRRSWSEKIYSECQMCDPLQNADEWSLKTGYDVDTNSNPPEDCTIRTDQPTKAPINQPTKAPINQPTKAPPTDKDINTVVQSPTQSDTSASVPGRTTHGIALLLCLTLIVHVH